MAVMRAGDRETTDWQMKRHPGVWWSSHLVDGIAEPWMNSRVALIVAPCDPDYAIDLGAFCGSVVYFETGCDPGRMPHVSRIVSCE